MTRLRRGTIVAGVFVLVALGFFATGHWLRGAAALVIAVIPFVIGLPWRRQVAFAAIAIAFSTAVTLAFVAAVDLYLHHRFSRTGGYNIWGYRGDPVSAKAPGETRIEYLGGSVAFGYGVSTDETIPAYLERELTSERPHVRVINLGWNSEGAHSMRPTLEDYKYLHSDAAILYSGYNDLLDTNLLVFRHSSALFRLTGYMPILPVIPIRDWLRLNNLSDTFTEKVVFKPNLADRYASGAAETALRISRALEHQLGRLTTTDPPTQVSREARNRWQFYTTAVREAVTTALDQHLLVFVVSEPYISEYHMEQQAAVAQMLSADFGGNPRVRYINAGRAVDLHDTSLCYDGMHLTAAGNRRVAAFLREPVLDGLRTLR
ncbi:MAG TPA: SGNH/GDSL hydrolase family protein [Vicinamibacterales bacterium]|nr:SGNH/GDSL hydrolase family protein [Vicinamibacterales bacterium]